MAPKPANRIGNLLEALKQGFARTHVRSKMDQPRQRIAFGNQNNDGGAMFKPTQGLAPFKSLIDFNLLNATVARMKMQVCSVTR